MAKAKTHLALRIYCPQHTTGPIQLSRIEWYDKSQRTKSIEERTISFETAFDLLWEAAKEATDAPD